MQASKARTSPCGRPAPGSAPDGRRHLDKQSVPRGSSFLLRISPNKTCRRCLLMPYDTGRLLCCRTEEGSGRGITASQLGFHLWTLSQRCTWTSLCPARAGTSGAPSFLALTPPVVGDSQASLAAHCVPKENLPAKVCPGLGSRTVGICSACSAGPPTRASVPLSALWKQLPGAPSHCSAAPG